jgi:hypothetical protein
MVLMILNWWWIDVTANFCCETNQVGECVLPLMFLPFRYNTLDLHSTPTLIMISLFFELRSVKLTLNSGRGQHSSSSASLLRLKEGFDSVGHLLKVQLIAICVLTLAVIEYALKR